MPAQMSPGPITQHQQAWAVQRSGQDDDIRAPIVSMAPLRRTSTPRAPIGPQDSARLGLIDYLQVRAASRGRIETAYSRRASGGPSFDSGSGE